MNVRPYFRQLYFFCKVRVNISKTSPCAKVNRVKIVNLPLLPPSPLKKKILTYFLQRIVDFEREGGSPVVSVRSSVIFTYVTHIVTHMLHMLHTYVTYMLHMLQVKQCLARASHSLQI